MDRPVATKGTRALLHSRSAASFRKLPGVPEEKSPDRPRALWLGQRPRASGHSLVLERPTLFVAGDLMDPGSRLRKNRLAHPLHEKLHVDWLV